jgi:hypothetical protein
MAVEPGHGGGGVHVIRLSLPPYSLPPPLNCHKVSVGRGRTQERDYATSLRVGEVTEVTWP